MVFTGHYVSTCNTRWLDDELVAGRSKCHRLVLADWQVESWLITMGTAGISQVITQLKRLSLFIIVILPGQGCLFVKDVWLKLTPRSDSREVW